MTVFYAIRRRFSQHERWATRCFLLLMSPLILRIASGVFIALHWEHPLLYVGNAWLSWLVPLAVYEMSCWPKRNAQPLVRERAPIPMVTEVMS
jgi:hypothetical protein